MFNPAAREAAKAELAEKKKIAAKLREWSAALVPVDLQPGLQIDVKEVACGDPNCAPVDTVFTLVWSAGGRGMFAVPVISSEISQETLPEIFPDAATLRKWFNKEEASWPPRPELRFAVGTRVECRIGPHSIRGWAPGVIIAQYYKEPDWPQSMYAPYQIQLDDGRLIFAPQDTNQVIRAEGSVTYTAEQIAAADAEEEEEYEEYDEEDDDGAEDA